MKLLHSLIQQYVWQQRSSARPRTLGDLEDIVITAVDNMNNLTPDANRDKKDALTFREHKVRSVRVNVKYAHKKEEFREVYEAGLKEYDIKALRETNILYWDLEKRIEHARKCLKDVGEKHVRGRSSSSSGIIPSFSFLVHDLLPLLDHREKRGTGLLPFSCNRCSEAIS